MSLGFKSLRITGPTSPPQHTPSRFAQRQVYVYFFVIFFFKVSVNIHSTAADKYYWFLPAVADKERVSLTCTAVGATGAESFLASNYICIACRQAHICLILATMKTAPTLFFIRVISIVYTTQRAIYIA